MVEKLIYPLKLCHNSSRTPPVPDKTQRSYQVGYTHIYIYISHYISKYPMMFPSSLVWLNPSTSPFLIPRPHSGHSAPGGTCGASAGARLATLGRQPRFAEWFTNSPGAGAVVVIGWLFGCGVGKASFPKWWGNPHIDDFPMKI